MLPPTAVLDACVLYPYWLRDLLVQLAAEDVFRARWTEEIHDEWTRNALANDASLDPDQLSRTRELMNLHVNDSLVSGHGGLIPSLTLPDPGDRHVLAAAIRCGAGVIVTWNLRHFPADILDGFGIEPWNPDDFLVGLLTADDRAVCHGLKVARGRLKRPPMTADEYLRTLERQRLYQTVERLREHVDLI